jgi:hypothetical protein
VTTIAIDGLNEEDFRRSIEAKLRVGQADEVIERLRGLLAPYAGPEGMLPDRFLTVEATDLSLSGWNTLGPAVGRHDRPGYPVTGLSIAFGWPGENAPQPDAEGVLRPHVQTSYFTDTAFPFSRSALEDLLDGYSLYGSSWSGDSVATDVTLSLEGVDDLHGALARLEAQLLASEEPDEEGIRAGSLGACLLSTLLVQAVNQRIEQDGLPRPLCVMAGSSDVYPYFDAPVAGMSEEAREAAEAQAHLTEAARGVPIPRYSSLLITNIPRGKKRAALVLDEGELATSMAKLRGLNPEGEDDATRFETNPIAPASEQPALAAGYSPLLVKKPKPGPRESEPLGADPEPPVAKARPHVAEPEPLLAEARPLVAEAEPRVTEPSPLVAKVRPLVAEPSLPVAEVRPFLAEPSPLEPADFPEPALPATRGGPLVGPEFSQPSTDLEQRLQSLLSTYAPPVVEAQEPAPPVPANRLRRHEPIALPARTSLRTRLRSWVGTGFSLMRIRLR